MFPFPKDVEYLVFDYFCWYEIDLLHPFLVAYLEQKYSSFTKTRVSSWKCSSFYDSDHPVDCSAFVFPSHLILYSNCLGGWMATEKITTQVTTGLDFLGRTRRETTFIDEHQNILDGMGSVNWGFALFNQG